MSPISGNQQLNSPAKVPSQDELISFLQSFDADTDIAEIETFADQFSDAERHLKKTQMSKEAAKEETMAEAAKADGNEEAAKEFKKGILSADAILSQSVLSPTGTQVISTLDIDARTIEAFRPLANQSLSTSHKKLARFIPQLQESVGRKQVTPTAVEFAGYYGLIDPLLLAAYIPFTEELIDLSEEQVNECFHGFQLVDGYPTINGVPVWERQEWERIDYYNLFKLFRDMRYAFYNESDALLTNRSLATLSKATQVPANLLLYLSQVYHWRLRSELYDSWMYAMQQRRAAVKTSLMLDRHTKISQALIQRAFSCLQQQADKMSPKEALEMLKLGLAYERISAGLLGDKPDQSTTNTQVSTPNGAPLISIVSQTNTTSGPMQVNNESQSQRQLGDDMKRNDTLLSILSVLQRSGAFEVLAQKAIDEQEPNEEVVDDGK